MATPPPDIPPGTGTGAGVDAGVPWRSFVSEAERRLRTAGFESCEIDARRIVEQASGCHGTALLSGLNEPASAHSVAHFDSMLQRRLAGEPLQYVLGGWSFRSIDLMVDRRVLIPRPETEQVVERALHEFDQIASRRRDESPIIVVDLGTGSGAIALSIAFERRRAQVWATDRSADALAVARSNLAGLGRAATRVALCEGSWFEALPGELQGRIDVLLSNPPYVAANDDLPAVVADWEPTGALIAGPTGTEHVEHLIEMAPPWLAPGGVFVVEMAPHQTQPMADRASRQGFAEVAVAPDLSGRDRMVIARR